MATRTLLALLGAAAAAFAAEPEVNTAQLNLNAAHGQRAELQLVSGREQYTLGAGERGFFVERNGKPVVTIGGDGEVRVHSDVVEVGTLVAEQLVLAGVPQWRMAALDVFGAEGRSPADAGWRGGEQTLKCAGLELLVGERRPLEESFGKTYEALPKHTQLRVQGTVHFVDDWQGDTAYLKVDGQHVWTLTHDQRNSKGAINLCGSDTFPESRFSVPIDLSLPHTAATAKLEFGSTLEVGAQASFGLSSLSVSLRSVAPPKPVVDAVREATANGAEPLDKKA